MANSHPKVNRAVVYAEPPTLKTEVVELPIPTPGQGEILIRLLFSGVCHTDYGFCTNAFHVTPTPAGQIGGHEGVGEVLSHGPGVTSPAIGSKVGIKYAAAACLCCSNCLRGGESSCTSASEYKVSGYLTPGTFQQYCVSSAKYATPIPDGIDDLAAVAPLMCGGVSVYAALKRAGLSRGDWVVVSGAGGGLGHLAVQYARVMGGRCLGIDVGGKEDFVRGLGAEGFLGLNGSESDEALGQRVRDVTGGGAQIVLVCAASARAYSQAIRFLDFRGTLCCLGIPPQAKEPALSADVLRMVDKELTIIANKSGNRLEAIETVDMAARYGIKTQYQLRKMTSLTTIFDEIKAENITGRVVLDLS